MVDKSLNCMQALIDLNTSSYYATHALLERVYSLADRHPCIRSNIYILTTRKRRALCVSL